tara:strand:+ start:75 stop:359 length:285 start_codon:yes stop_codon:yes gene_type:complete
MIDTDKCEGHTPAAWMRRMNLNGLYSQVLRTCTHAERRLIEDAPLFLEFIQKIVKDWCKPNQCNQAFGKDVRRLMYEYGLITFNEETSRYEVKE